MRSAFLDQVTDSILAQEHEESSNSEMVQQVHAADGLYPLNHVWRLRHEARPAANGEGHGNA